MDIKGKCHEYLFLTSSHWLSRENLNLQSNHIIAKLGSHNISACA